MREKKGEEERIQNSYLETELREWRGGVGGEATENWEKKYSRRKGGKERKSNKRE